MKVGKGLVVVVKLSVHCKCRGLLESCIEVVLLIVGGEEKELLADERLICEGVCQ